MGHADGEAAHVYCMLNGTVTAVDQTFVDWFGLAVDDCVGSHLGALTAEGDAVRALYERFSDWRAEGNVDGRKRIEAGECSLPQVSEAPGHMPWHAHIPPPCSCPNFRYCCCPAGCHVLHACMHSMGGRCTVMA